MAAPNVRVALQIEASLTYQRLPDHHKQSFVDKINSFPPKWLEKPVNDERFDSPDQCLERLNAYGFFAGCLFVSGNQRKDKTKTWEYLCKFHGDKMANKRKLEDRVERDTKGEITSRRVRDTHNQRFSCPVAYTLSYRLVSRSKEGRETG